MRFLLVCVLAGLFLIGLSAGQSRAQQRQIEEAQTSLKSVEQEVRTMAILVCWRLGQRAVLSPPGTDRPSVQCEEAAL